MNTSRVEAKVGLFVFIGLVFLAAALMSLVGAFFSAIRGERYVHVDESLEAEATAVRA